MILRIWLEVSAVVVGGGIVICATQFDWPWNIGCLWFGVCLVYLFAYLYENWRVA